MDSIEGGMPFLGSGPEVFFRLSGAKQRACRGYQYFRIDRFRQVAVGTPLEAAYAVTDLARRRRNMHHRNELRGWIRFDPAADLEAVYIREIDIEDDEIRHPGYQLQCFAPGGRFQYAKTSLLKDPGS